MFPPHHLAHLRRVTHFLGKAVQSPCLCPTPCREVLSRHQHLRLGHWFLLETFWAVFAKVSNATTAQASRPWRIWSISGAGVCELELWLKLRSRLTTFGFCRDSFQVTRVRTASSSSIGHDSSVVLLSVSKFVIRASISPESTSDVDCSSRGIRGSF